MPRHGENIRKRADGRWEGRYIEYYFNDGKACYRSVYGKTYSEIKEKLKQCKKLCNRNTGNRITMEELFKEWLNMKEDTIKSSTKVTYSYFIDKHFTPQTSHKQTHHKPQKIAKNRTKKVKESRNRKHFTQAGRKTRNNISHQLISLFFSQAILFNSYFNNSLENKSHRTLKADILQLITKQKEYFTACSVICVHASFNSDQHIPNKNDRYIGSMCIVGQAAAASLKF